MRKQRRNYQIARIYIENHVVTWIEEVDVWVVARSERFGLGRRVLREKSGQKQMSK